ncbi:hypothetical protein ACUODJ_16340, partial [Escherichia sp. HC-CC]
PDGIYAQVAVYSDHFSHVSVMRQGSCVCTWADQYLSNVAIARRANDSLLKVIFCFSKLRS